MLYHIIPNGVLQRAFGFDDIHDVHKYVRLDCWGEGSCFFHSLCLLLVIRNEVQQDKRKKELTDEIAKLKRELNEQ